MSLSSCLTTLYQRLSYSTTPPAAVTTRLTNQINEAQQDIVGELGGARLLNGAYTLTSVTNTPEYGLANGVARVRSVRDIANRVTLGEVSEAQYRQWVADPSTITGTPRSYADLGLFPVQAQPSDASELFLVSSSASDVQVAFYEVLLSSGSIIQGQVTLTGLTAVSLSASLTTITKVLDLYLASAAIGTISLKEDSGAGTTLSQIRVGRTREQFAWIALIPTPSSALNYAVDFERDATDLVNTTDTSPIPVRFERTLIARTLMFEYLRQGDETRYGLAQREYRRELGLLNHYLTSGPDQITIPGRVRAANSVLPSNFPTSLYGGG